MEYVGSTARDLAPFLRAHLDGHPAVPATADETFAERVVETGWDVSIGQMRLLLGQAQEPTGPDPALTHGAPVVLWGLVVLLGVAATWFLTRALPRWRREPRTLQGRRRLRRVVLPAVAYLAVGVVLWVATPLEAARHFSPDIGWAATVHAFALPAWALVKESPFCGRVPCGGTGP